MKSIKERNLEDLYEEISQLERDNEKLKKKIKKEKEESGTGYIETKEELSKFIEKKKKEFNKLYKTSEEKINSLIQQIESLEKKVCPVCKFKVEGSGITECSNCNNKVCLAHHSKYTICFDKHN